MKTTYFNCPACGERGQASAELTGQAVTCPACSQTFVTEGKTLQVSMLGWWMACGGFLLWLIGRIIPTGEFPDVIVLEMTCGALLFGIGLAVICWQSREWIMAGGRVFFALGAAVFGVCALLNIFSGICIGGFIAVIGAVFISRK